MNIHTLQQEREYERVLLALAFQDDDSSSEEEEDWSIPRWSQHKADEQAPARLIFPLHESSPLMPKGGGTCSRERDDNVPMSDMIDLDDPVDPLSLPGGDQYQYCAQQYATASPLCSIYPKDHFLPHHPPPFIFAPERDSLMDMDIGLGSAEDDDDSFVDPLACPRPRAVAYQWTYPVYVYPRATPNFHRPTPKFHRPTPKFHRPATPKFHRPRPSTKSSFSKQTWFSAVFAVATMASTNIRFFVRAVSDHCLGRNKQSSSFEWVPDRSHLKKIYSSFHSPSFEVVV